MKKSITLFLLTLGFLYGSAQQPLDEVKKKYIERITKAMKKNKVVGASLIVTSGDSVIWSHNFGYADLNAEVPTTENTFYGIGSVTKTLTGAAIMQQVAKGTMELDKPLSTYLPSFDIQGDGQERITVRNVMTHHSGLPSDIMKGMFTTQPEDYTEVVNYINNEHIAGAPNTIRAYSNPGYSLLGHALSATTGQDYEAYMTENVLQPLGMNNSSFNNLEDASKTYDSKGEEKQDVLLRDTPAGGLFSSTAEMKLFVQSFLKKEGLFKEDIYEQIFTQQHMDVALNMDDRYALGWNMAKKKYTGDIFNHTGTTMYFNAAMSIAPEANLGAVILTNSEKGGRVYREINSMLNDFAEAMGKTEQTNVKEDSLGPKKRIATEKGAFTDLTGIYATPGAYFNVYQKGKKLFMRIQGIKVELIPVADKAFIPKPILLGIIPIKLNETRMYFEEIDGHFVMTQKELNAGKELLVKRVDIESIPTGWKNRMGSYEIVNQLPGEINFFKNFELLEKDGVLVMAFQQASNGQKIEMVMGIESDERAKVEGLGRYAGQSLYTTAEDTLTFFGLELKKSQP